jgi:hypothetical protein
VSKGIAKVVKWEFEVEEGGCHTKLLVPRYLDVRRNLSTLDGWLGGWKSVCVPGTYVAMIRWIPRRT